MKKTTIAQVFIGILIGVLFLKDVFGSISLKTNCFIESYSKIYYQKDAHDKDWKKIIKKSTCPEKIDIQFLNLIKKSQGVFSTKHLQKLYLTEIKNKEITIFPKKIHIKELNRLLSDLIDSNGDIIPRKSLFLGKRNFLLLNTHQKIQMLCADCKALGKKNITLQIYSKKSKKSIWIETTFKTKKKALVSKSDLAYSFENEISLSNFKEDIIETEQPEKFFLEKEYLHFFKLTRSLKKNEPLKSQDLLPRQLVKAFTPVKIILKSNGIQLSSIAIAKKNGRWGEYITLENKKSRRLLIGKVIDFNKVLVEI